MSIQLTIIGLGQIGSSIGLALAQHGEKIKRIGTDIDRNVIQQALKINAIDKAEPNLNAAVKNADIVILALPLDQVRDMVEALVPVLKDDAILMETSPVKVPVANWMRELLPETSHYIGLTPVLNPAYIHNETYGISAARTDLFQNGLFCIVTLPGVSSQAVKLATDLIQLMGANPLFIDLHENDGLMAATHILPQVMSAALLNASLNKPGWNEARKIAGRAFAEVTGPAAHLDEPEALAASAISNRDNILRKLDDIIAGLQAFRLDISQEDSDAIIARLKHARAGVNQWWKQRGAGDWLAIESPRETELPSGSDLVKSLFGFGLGRKKKKD